MAENNLNFTYPLGIAGADLSAKQYHFVKLSAANVVVQETAAGTTCIGVLANNPTSGRAAAVTVFGQSKITATTGISAGGLISSNASGRATPAASGDYAMGRALEASAAEGDVITAMIFPTRVLV